MNKLFYWVRSVPTISWFLLLIAIALGAAADLKNPEGIWLHTPRLWCGDKRVSAFAAGALFVLLPGVIASGLIALIALCTRIVRDNGGPDKGGKSWPGPWRPPIASMLMLLIATAVVLTLGDLLPVQVDVVCRQVR